MPRLEGPGRSKCVVVNVRLSAMQPHTIGRETQRCVMVEAAPASPFEVAEPNLLLEFVVIALNGGKASCSSSHVEGCSFSESFL
jgi:hypothetical protein